MVKHVLLQGQRGEGVCGLFVLDLHLVLQLVNFHLHGVELLEDSCSIGYRSGHVGWAIGLVLGYSRYVSGLYPALNSLAQVKVPPGHGHHRIFTHLATPCRANHLPRCLPSYFWI